MTFLEFCEATKKEIEQKVNPEFTIKINETMKNNGEKLTGLSIIKDEGSVTPIIYLEDLYHDFQNGQTVPEIAETAIHILTQYENPKLDFDAADFACFEKQKNCIGIRLINTERNRDMLTNVPHIDFLDLSIIFICIVKNERKEIVGSITIQNDFLDEWGVTTNELYELAKENMKRELPSITMSLSELLGIDMPENNLIMISNNNKNFGAAAILYDDTLERLAKQCDSDLFILPSSIHECLALPVCSADDINDTAATIKGTIEDVNKTMVSEKEFLSDNLYFYSKDKNTLKIFE